MVFSRNVLNGQDYITMQPSYQYPFDIKKFHTIRELTLFNFADVAVEIGTFDIIPDHVLLVEFHTVFYTSSIVRFFVIPVGVAHRAAVQPVKPS